MRQEMKFDELQTEKIRKLAEEKRRGLGFVGETAIAKDILTILENMDIVLLELPIKSDCDQLAFSAAIMYLKEDDEELVFMGLNTADYFDNQVFAIAHELYHFFTKTGSHLSRLGEKRDLIETKANRFAAEFLLPESTLESIIINEFKRASLFDLQIKTLLRFIARLQCTWCLPYRSLVRRLKEINAISDIQYSALYAINERDMDEEYGKIGLAINSEVFCKLNTITKNVGASPKNIEIIIRNFEDGLIDEEAFANTLSLFAKKPQDFGHEYAIAGEDWEEFKALFNGEKTNAD